MMWLFTFFDLPTNTAGERKTAAKFRKELIKDGFTMMQYSVYIRHCASRESMEVHRKRIKLIIPKKGSISILPVTDKQYGLIDNFCGKETDPPKPAPKQLEMF